MDDEKEGDFIERLAADSKKVMHGFIEPEIRNAQPGDKFQCCCAKGISVQTVRFFDGTYCTEYDYRP